MIWRRSFLIQTLNCLPQKYFVSTSRIPGFGDPPVSEADLREPESIEVRRSPAYVKRVLSVAEELLPDVSGEQLAKMVFADRALLQKLHERIETALRQRQSKLRAQQFVRSQVPMASIVVPALLYRTNENPEDILSELDLLENKAENRFTGKTNWVHNNFVGCLLQLYEPHSQACPFYAGFKTYCQLAHWKHSTFPGAVSQSISRAFCGGESGVGCGRKLSSRSSTASKCSFSWRSKKLWPARKSVTHVCIEAGVLICLWPTSDLLKVSRNNLIFLLAQAP